MLGQGIEPAQVKAALDAIGRARPFGESPLLDLACVKLQLHRQGLASSESSREWALQEVLIALVRRELARLRPEPLDPESGVRAILRADFATDLPLLHAWSATYCTYLASEQHSKASLAQMASVSPSTLWRLRSTGIDLLTDTLREHELGAARELAALGLEGFASRVAIVDDPGQLPATIEETFASLRKAALDDAVHVQIDAGRLAELQRHAPTGFDQYRLMRLAEWCAPGYRLDRRFVSLGLLIDHGEEALAGRWATTEQRFEDLGQVLAGTTEPALVVLGAPGAGKSTLLRHLEVETAIRGLHEQDEHLTFFVPLGRFRPEQPGGPPPAPADWLAEIWRRRYPDLPDLDELLRQGRMILLLDALNEMAHDDPDEYSRLVGLWKAFVQDLASERPRNRIVFSCRSLDYSAPLSTPDLRVPQVRIEPLDDAQVRDFLERHSPEWSEAIWRTLSDGGSLDALRTPFLLGILVDQVHASGEVPQGSAALFTGYVRQALARELQRQNPLLATGELLSARDRKRLALARRWRNPTELPAGGPLFPALSRLAYEMQRSHGSGAGAQVRVDYDEAVAILGGADAEDILAAGSALGLLDEDLDVDELLFVHQLLQEYFAARQLAEHPEPELVARPWRVGEVKPSLEETLARLAPADPLPPLPTTGWEETMVLAAAMEADPERTLRRLMDLNLPLAAECARSSDIAIAPELGHALRAALIARSRDSSADIRERIRACESLGWLGDPRLETHEGPHGVYLLPPFAAISGGQHWIGTDQPCYPEEAPAHEVQIGAFSIARYPVTNAEWMYFMKSQGYEHVEWWDNPTARAWLEGKGTSDGSRYNVRRRLLDFIDNPETLAQLHRSGTISDEMHRLWKDRLRMDSEELEQHLADLFPDSLIREPRYWKQPRFANPNQPVVGICWHEARAYCTWLSAQSGRQYRLPSEAEWEIAARGPSRTEYPYGNKYISSAANTVEAHIGRPSPIGVFPDGDSPSGATDMSGNVFEWTLSAFGTNHAAPEYLYPYASDDGREQIDGPSDVTRVLRGGGWAYDHTYARSVLRLYVHPANRLDTDGFRLVLSGM